MAPSGAGAVAKMANSATITSGNCIVTANYARLPAPQITAVVTAANRWVYQNTPASLLHDDGTGRLGNNSLLRVTVTNATGNHSYTVTVTQTPVTDPLTNRYGNYNDGYGG